MSNLFYPIGIYGLLLPGALHCLLTFRRYRSSEEDAYWFFAAGLALVAYGLLNYMHAHTGGSQFYWLVVLANGLLVAFALALALRLRKPTAYVVLVVSTLVLVASLATR